MADPLWQPEEAVYPALSSFPLSRWIVDELHMGVGLPGEGRWGGVTVAAGRKQVVCV